MHELYQAVKNTTAKIIDSCTFEWGASKKLFLLVVEFSGKRGVLLHYENPPVHQIDTEALDGYAAALDRIEEQRDELSFLIFSFAPDLVHAGGDLKETLANLERKEGYEWADVRLHKAFRLYKRVRALAKHMHVISILAGGTYYGGSAEFALWADRLLGDSRSSICMSEACIGLIPGWSGVARLITKAGYLNACCLVATARKVNAQEMKALNILDEIVEIRQAEESLPLLFSRALWFACNEVAKAPITSQILLMSQSEIEKEVNRRSNPYMYRALWRKPIVEVRDEIARLKTPLASQSILALWALFASFAPGDFDEERFARKEMECDAALYRHPLLGEGIRAVLDKRVPNFEQRKEESR